MNTTKIELDVDSGDISDELYFALLEAFKQKYGNIQDNTNGAYFDKWKISCVVKEGA